MESYEQNVIIVTIRLSTFYLRKKHILAYFCYIADTTKWENQITAMTAR